MTRIRINLIPIIFFLFEFVISRNYYYAVDASDKAVFQFPEYDYKETSKNVSFAYRFFKTKMLKHSI